MLPLSTGLRAATPSRHDDVVGRLPIDAAAVIRDTGSVLDLRRLYLDSCSTTLDLVARPEVEANWTSPSVLPELTVGALAAHVGRALVTVDAYLDGEAPPADAEVVDASGYLVAVLGDHDPVESDFHRSVRGRSESAAAGGRGDVVASLRAVHERLSQMPDDLGRPIAVIGGLRMELGEYVKTRLVELAIHGRDLADSIDAEPPVMPDGCWEVVSSVLLSVAARRNDPADVALALARADRFARIIAL